jgi:Icc-related predicted phosphoesterase
LTDFFTENLRQLPTPWTAWNFAPAKTIAPEAGLRHVPQVRILSTADLHYALRQFDWVGEQLEYFDVVVLAGDLLDIASAVDLDVQEVVVEKYLRRFASQRVLLSASGNHDIQETRNQDERSAKWMESLRAPNYKRDYESHSHGEVLFTVCPWWDGPETRKKTEERLEADAAKSKQTWIWLHHNPPLGTPVAWTGRSDGGDAVALEWIERYQPDFVFSGHIHNAPFYAAGSWHARIGKSLVFNAGKQLGGEPTHIILDLETRRAQWLSLESEESIEF